MLNSSVDNSITAINSLLYKFDKLGEYIESQSANVEESTASVTQMKNGKNLLFWS